MAGYPDPVSSVLTHPPELASLPGQADHCLLLPSYLIPEVGTTENKTKLNIMIYIILYSYQEMWPIYKIIQNISFSQSKYQSISGWKTSFAFEKLILFIYGDYVQLWNWKMSIRDLMELDP